MAYRGRSYRGAAQYQPYQTTNRNVSYGKHFPHTFLAPYGRVYEPQDDVDLIQRLRPYTCEWFKRPDVAMSEFAHTVRDNMPLLDSYSGNVFHEDMVQGLHDVYDPLMDSFSRLNKKEHPKERAGKRDVLQVMGALLEEDDEFDDMIDSLYESAAAMYLLAVQTKVIRALLRNPDMYAAKCETPDGSHLSFQNVRSIPEMQLFITNAIVPLGGEAPRRRGRHLANELRDLDLEPAQAARQVPRRATRLRTGATQLSHTVTSLQEEDDNAEDLQPPPTGRSRQQRRMGARRTGQNAPSRRPVRPRTSRPVDEEDYEDYEDEEPIAPLQQTPPPRRRPIKSRATRVVPSTPRTSSYQPEESHDDMSEQEAPRRRPIKSRATRVVPSTPRTSSYQPEESHDDMSEQEACSLQVRKLPRMRNTKITFTYSSDEEPEDPHPPPPKKDRAGETITVQRPISPSEQTEVVTKAASKTKATPKPKAKPKPKSKAVAKTAAKCTSTKSGLGMLLQELTD